MKLCRYESNGSTFIGLYEVDRVIDLAFALKAISKHDLSEAIQFQSDLIDLLPPDSALWSELLASSKT